MDEVQKKQFVEKLRRAKEDAFERNIIKKAEKTKKRAEQRQTKKINIISNVQIQLGNNLSEKQNDAVSSKKNDVASSLSLTAEREKNLGENSDAERIRIESLENSFENKLEMPPIPNVSKSHLIPLTPKNKKCTEAKLTKKKCSLKIESTEKNENKDIKTFCSEPLIPDKENKPTPKRQRKLKTKISCPAKCNYNTYKSRIRRAGLTEEQKQIIKEKDRLRKRKAKEDGKILSVTNMPERQKRKQRKIWRESKKRLRKKKKSLLAVIDATPPSSDIEEHNVEEINIADKNIQTTPKQELQLNSESNSHSLKSSLNDFDVKTPSNSITNNRKRKLNQSVSDTDTTPSYQMTTAKRLKNNKIRKMNRELDKMRKEISESKSKIEKLQRERDRYKKRLERKNKKDAIVLEKTVTLENQIPDNTTENENSPNTKVKILIKDRVIPEDVKRELLFGVAFKDQVLANLAESPLKPQNKICETMLAGNLLTKYRLHKKVAQILPYKKNKVIIKNNRKNTSYKRQKNLFKEVAKSKVKLFFESDSISRMCPGKANVITRKKIKKQKRLLNYSLKSCFSQFKREHPSDLISFSTFYQNKPFWVVQPSLKDRETCACVKHANFKFIVSKLFNEKIVQHQNFEKFLNNDYELNLPDENKNDTVTIFQWKTIAEDRKIGNQIKNIRFTSKVTLKITKYELLNFFAKELPVFKIHLKTMLHQMKYLEDTKKSLRENKCVIQIDFSENYVAKLNSEIQSMHFGASKRQISIHTGVAYYWQNETEPAMISFATVSDNLDHNAYAIWCHMKPVLDLLSRKFDAQNLETLYMFSDGPSSQYRNKFNIYLAVTHLKKAFPNSEISWNFSASGHGKGPMDGIGGTIKRLADSCVSRGGDITSAKDFVDLVKPELKKTYLFEIESQNISEAKATLAEKNYPMIKNISQAHQITWGDSGVVHTRSLSCESCPFNTNCCHFPIMLSTSNKQIPVPSIKEVLQVPPSVGSWVTAVFGESNPNWYPGVITAVNNDQLTVKFLKRSRKNYLWPIKDDVQTIKHTEILCVLNHPPKSVSKSREQLFSIPEEEIIEDMFKSQILK